MKTTVTLNDIRIHFLAKVPLTPEPKRSKPPKQKPPIKMANAETNDNRKGMVLIPLNQSKAEIKIPIKSEVCGMQSFSCASESIRSSKKGFSTPPFAHSSPSFPFRSHFRQQGHNSKNYRSSSLNDMCLFGNFIRCQNKKPRTKKEQQRRHSDSAVPKKEERDNFDYLCFPSRFKIKKKKRLMTEPTQTQQTEQMIVKTPDVIRVNVSEISSPLQPRRVLQTYCLQVKIDDDSLNKRSSSRSALSSPASKRKINTLGTGRRSKLRCDSGIASNFSFISTDISTSSPSLCYPQHSDSLMTSPSTFFSSSSPSSLDNYEVSRNRSHAQKCSLGSSLHSTHSQSSITAQHIATLEDSLRFVDDEDPNDEIICSEQRINEKESFIKPGMPPLRNQNRHEVETKQSQNFRPQIMNPDSKASSDSIEDRTLTEDYDVEFPEDLSLQSDANYCQSCEEQKNQGSENFSDLLSVNSTHFDKQNPQENYPLKLMENTDPQREQKLENELFYGMHFDEQIPPGRCLEKVAESTDSRDKARAFESEGFQLTKKNSRKEFLGGQEFFVDRLDSNDTVRNNPEPKVAQENIEAVPCNALISPAKADDFKNSPVSSDLKSLENENELISKQNSLVIEHPQQPEIINNQLQEQSETMTETMQPSMISLDGVNSAVKTGDNEDELLGLNKGSSLLRNIQAAKSDEKYSKVQEPVDSGLEDSSKIGGASVYPQNDLILTARTESVESDSLSEESVLLSANKPFDNATNLLALDEKGNPKYQEGPSQALCDRTPQNELITVVKADYLECHPPISPSENMAVLCQKPLSVSNSEDHIMPEHLRTDVEQTDAKRDISIQQNQVNCESLAPKEPTLIEKPDSTKFSSPESDNKRTDVCGRRRILGGEVCPKPKRRSILFDQDRSDDVFNQEACEVLREMLKDPTPETFQLVRYAVKTYDQYSSLSDSVNFGAISVYACIKSQPAMGC